jgi:hypothetical protein
LTYRFLIFLLLTALHQKANAQPGNLVPNPGFEDRLTCVWNDGTLTDCPPWFRPTGGHPDVFHVCTVVNEDPCPYPEPTNWSPWMFGVPTNVVGCQESHSGQGYAGTFYLQPGIAPLNEYREYLAVELFEEMQAGQQYYVRYYVSLAEQATHAIWALQVLFLNEPYFNMDSPTYISLVPSLTHTTGSFVADKDGWTEISGIYTATGGERYLYMGNFQANADVESLDVNMPEQNIYSVQHNSAYYFVDDVYVGTELLSVSQSTAIDFTLWPNPVINELQVKVNSPSTIAVYSVTGASCLQPTQIDGQVTINVTEWSSGVYLIKVIGSDKIEVHRFLKL